MATWKKIIVSGSNAHLAQITSSVLTDGYLVMAGVGGALKDSNISLSGGDLNIGANSIISTGAGSVVSGSFSGSFQGDGSGLTGVQAQVEESLLLGTGLFGGTFDGLTAITASIDSGSLAGDGLTTSAGKFAVSASDNKITVSANGISVDEANFVNIPNAALTNDSIQIGSTSIALGATGSSVADLTLTNVIATGSFSGSFVGTTDLPDLTQGAGVVPFTYDGSGTATVAVSGAAALSTNAVTKWDGSSFVNSTLTDNGSVISGASSIQLSGASSVLSGSFSGSFQGDGSGLTGLVTDLDISGSDGTGITIDLKTQDLTITGTANEIETTVAGTTVTIGLPNDVTIGQDLIVSRNLTVLGTASFQHTEDLDVADRFIRLASGSNSAGDGGIAIQQSNALDAEVFGFDSGATRWGVSSSFDASQNAFTPDAYMALVLEGAGTDPTVVDARYQVKGNIFIGSDEGIWIYS